MLKHVLTYGLRAALCLAAHSVLAAEGSEGILRKSIALGEGTCEVVVDTERMPELTAWAQEAIVPMAAEWLPRLATMLPSDGFAAPSDIRIVFDPEMGGVAATGGGRIRCSGTWMRANRDGEAVGAVFHELVHVVQQYGHRHRAPGWLVEGIADYLRWFVYEPESHGAEISAGRIERVRYDNSYRVTANFLDWLCRTHGADLVTRLNAEIREGRYHDGIWLELTGEDPDTLDAAWKRDLAAASKS